MTRSFPEITGKLGFGCLRIPIVDGDIDFKPTCELIDAFLASGNNYFDTSTIYLNGKSEETVRRCVAERYPRDSFKVGNKMTGRLFETIEDVNKAFDAQLQACGVEFFDFYMMHGLNREEYEKYSRVGLFDWAQQMKAQGKMGHVGFSFHDSATLLEKILDEHPEMEFVQLQVNYADYRDETVQAEKCLQVCREHGKPVFVMEPNKGGILTGELPQAAAEIIARVAERENATVGQLGMLFCGSIPEVEVILSGMGSAREITENDAACRREERLSEESFNELLEVRPVLDASGRIECTQCHYCHDACPMSIDIPRLIGILNGCRAIKGGVQKCYYRTATTDRGKAGDCIGCRSCVSACPQELPIPDLMAELAAIYE